MKIKYHKRFEKQFAKLSEKDKKNLIVVIGKFINNPKHSSLKNHPLKGALLGKRAM